MNFVADMVTMRSFTPVDITPYLLSTVPVAGTNAVGTGVGVVVGVGGG
jgi:hypothetical protein